MDATANPFAPGAGTQPPELAGREPILLAARTALQRIRAGRSAKGQMLLGLRGVGKTVLLNRIAEIATDLDCHPVLLEAPEDRRLADLLVSPLRSLLFQLSRNSRVREAAKKGLGVLRAFAKAFKVKVGEIEFSVDPRIGTADSGDIETDLAEVLVAVGEAARGAKSGVALFLDEMQYLSQEDFAALITAAHKTAQRNLPFLLFGAGLPQLAALAGQAKSYAERLFDYPAVGPLADADARAAIEAPLRREKVAIDADALQRILDRTQGYPYFLQEWGSRSWNAAKQSPIELADVVRASRQAIVDLDEGFFRVRMDRLTPRERDYVRAMAALGSGPYGSGDVAKELGMAVTAVAPLRGALIRKGMVYSPGHGLTAFTVPMFDDYLRRALPDWTSRARPARPAKRAAAKAKPPAPARAKTKARSAQREQE